MKLRRTRGQCDVDNHNYDKTLHRARRHDWPDARPYIVDYRMQNTQPDNWHSSM